MNKGIRMEITASNLSFGEVNRVLRSQITFYGDATALKRRRKTKFPTVKPPIYLPKWQIWMQLSPKFYFSKKAYAIGMLQKHFDSLRKRGSSNEYPQHIFVEK